MVYKCKKCDATDKLLYYIDSDYSVSGMMVMPDISQEGYVDEDQPMVCHDCMRSLGIKRTLKSVRAHNLKI